MISDSRLRWTMEGTRFASAASTDEALRNGGFAVTAHNRAVINTVPSRNSSSMRRNFRLLNSR